MSMQVMRQVFTFKIGILYLYFGMTLPAVAASFEATKELAEQGYTSAQNDLGKMYAEGRGVPRDPNKSFLWFLAAANTGDASAQNNLGGNYYNGYGVQQNTAKAVEWFQKSANQGYAPAKANLRSLKVNDSNVGIVSTKVAAYSQDVVLRRYNIPSLGQISIPTNMELQAGKYKELNKEYRQVFSDQTGLVLQLTGNEHIFQPRGINNFDKNALAIYARVIVETDIGKYGDYLRVSSPYSLSSGELSQISRETYNEMQSSLSPINIKIIRWDGVRPVKVNNQNALEVSYSRQLNNNPYVVVKIYHFQNNDRGHRLTVSYRQEDEKLWKPLFDKTLNSLTIYPK